MRGRFRWSEVAEHAALMALGTSTPRPFTCWMSSGCVSGSPRSPHQPEKRFELCGISLRVRSRCLFGDGTPPIGRFGEDKRFRDQDGLDALSLKVPHHLLRLGEGLAVLIEVAHVTMQTRPEPVEVEDDRVDGNVVL